MNQIPVEKFNKLVKNTTELNGEKFENVAILMLNNHSELIDHMINNDITVNYIVSPSEVLEVIPPDRSTNAAWRYGENMDFNNRAHTLNIGIIWTDGEGVSTAKSLGSSANLLFNQIFGQLSTTPRLNENVFILNEVAGGEVIRSYDERLVVDILFKYFRDLIAN